MAPKEAGIEMSLLKYVYPNKNIYHMLLGTYRELAQNINLPTLSYLQVR